MMQITQGQLLLGRFELVRLLGRGGMGQVWLAQDRELTLSVALKLMHPDLAVRADLVELLKSECRHARQLVHPHIVRTFDFHRSSELVFISMAYVEGESLSAYLRRQGALSPADALQRLLPITDALAFAHEQGLVHRDVKGGNILIDRSGVSLLTDFGISGAVHANQQNRLWTNGGSPYSISPQQLANQPPQPCDDLYGLGVLLYELLTGSPPFHPDISAEKIHSEIPPRISEISGTATAIPPELDDLVAGLLAKQPQDRPAGMRQVQAALNEILTPPGNLTLPPQSRPDSSGSGPVGDTRLNLIPPLSPPPEKHRDGSRLFERRKRIAATAIVAAFAALVTGGGLLLNHLSHHPVQPAPATRPSIEPSPQATQPPAATPAITADATEIEKTAAENKLAQFQKRKTDLDARGADVWAAEQYVEMMRISGQADEFLVRKQYAAAAAGYESATQQLEQMAALAPKALERALSDGTEALGRGDDQTARKAFELALKIDPESQAARRGLDRSLTLRSVLQFIETGRAQEKQGAVAAALESYRRALKQDPEAEEARQGAVRLEAQLTEQSLRRHISAGLAALNQGNFSAARSALNQARQIRPNGPEVVEALTRLDAAERLSDLEKLKAQARTAELAEQWESALKHYQAALQIDSTLQFAIEGQERCATRSELDQRLQFFLAEPQVLESDANLTEATNLLKSAEAVSPRGPRLQDQLQQLARLVQIAGTPVAVTLLSDGQTEVAVYKVGRFGRFSRQELSLRPGRYTVVGMRKGYRDIRREIVVRAEEAPFRVRIECSEKIN
jgi:serine/threonine protein kinase/tetratricopeptide (TPR) repeat protein